MNVPEHWQFGQNSDDIYDVVEQVLLYVGKRVISEASLLLTESLFIL